MPLAIIIGINFVIVVFMFTNVAYFTAMSPEELLQSDAVAVVSTYNLHLPESNLYSRYAHFEITARLGFLRAWTSLKNTCASNFSTTALRERDNWTQPPEPRFNRSNNYFFFVYLPIYVFFFSFILFHLFSFILFYFILFYFILFYFILFCFILFCFIFYFISFHFNLKLSWLNRITVFGLQVGNRTYV